MCGCLAADCARSGNGWPTPRSYKAANRCQWVTQADNQVPARRVLVAPPLPFLSWSWTAFKRRPNACASHHGELDRGPEPFRSGMTSNRTTPQERT